MKNNNFNPAHPNGIDFSSVKLSIDDSCTCDCNCTTNTCNCANIDKVIKVDFNIKIDEKSVHVANAALNIVEVAKTAGIAIPAPCFLAKKRHGCCMACVVEIDNKQVYACGTKPIAGMKIVVNRDDLKAIRKDRLLKYQQAIKNNNPLKCGVTDSQ